LLDEPDREPGTFGTDTIYRDAAKEYERRCGRHPEAKDPDQAGHDLDSFDKPLDDPERELVRRIEVKGRSCRWEENETVELSSRQFQDAHDQTVDDVEGELADEFDYWLYIVEPDEDGRLQVVPIRNPVRRTAKFEFRAATWRPMADRKD
jgi:hypothetical protein